jgi:hypothetical protein
MELTYAESISCCLHILFVKLSFYLLYTVRYFFSFFKERSLDINKNSLLWKPNNIWGERVLFTPVTSIIAIRGFLVSAQSFSSIGSFIAQKVCIHQDISSQTSCLPTRWNGISKFEFSLEISKTGCHNRQQFLRLPNFQPRAISGIQFPILARNKRGYIWLSHS